MSTQTSSRTERPYSFGPLYDFLMEKFPDHRTVQGVFNVPTFSEALGRSNEWTYRMLRSNKMTAEQAKMIIALAQDGETAASRITIEETIPFVFA